MPGGCGGWAGGRPGRTIRLTRHGRGAAATARFRTEHPEVRFTLVPGSADVLLTRLLTGEVDVCLTVPLPEEPGVAVPALDEQRIDLFGPAGHRLARRRGIQLAEPSGEDFICMEPGYGLRVITDELCRAAGFAPRVAFEGVEVATASDPAPGPVSAFRNFALRYEGRLPR